MFREIHIQIESWKLERLIPYARNARTHTARQVAQIAESIATFGFANPVLADPNGSIIAGHARVLAARKLGLEEVPVIVLHHLNEDQKRAFRIADKNSQAMPAGMRKHCGRNWMNWRPKFQPRRDRFRRAGSSKIGEPPSTGRQLRPGSNT